MVIEHSMLARLMAYHCLYEPETEIRDLLAVIAETPARAFLEIGTHKGFTSAVVACAFPQLRVVTVDLPDPTHTQWNPLPGSQVGEAHRAVGVQHRVEQRLLDSAELWRFKGRGEVYDVVFIDGDHSFDAVFRDLVLAADLLPAEGGKLIAHDYTDPHESHRPHWTIGVQHAVDRFVAIRPFHKRRLAGLLVALEKQPAPRQA